jgi:hypothetical protein
MDQNTVFGMDLSTMWDADTWDKWREEVERRVIEAERRADAHLAALGVLQDALHEAGLSAHVDGEPTLAEALDEYATTGTVTTPTMQSTQVVHAGDGSVTVDLTPITGGVFGSAPVVQEDETQGVGPISDIDAKIAANAAANAVAASVKRTRAPRVSPTDAKLRVQQVLMSAQTTVRGIGVWEGASGFSYPLTTSQARAALTSLEQEGKVYVAGKRGKQEVWALRP